MKYIQLYQLVKQDNTYSYIISSKIIPVYCDEEEEEGDDWDGEDEE